jgi:hypothetical protein
MLGKQTLIDFLLLGIALEPVLSYAHLSDYISCVALLAVAAQRWFSSLDRWTRPFVAIRLTKGTTLQEHFVIGTHSSVCGHCKGKMRMTSGIRPVDIPTVWTKLWIQALAT